ncbi:MAG: SigE family RNA polymerase sigma factor [Acidimicrobiales bacterium]
MSAAGGGQDRFEDFYHRHVDELARLAWLVLGDGADADDVAADALMAAWRQWDRVCASDRPVAYVRRMVVNIAVSRIRTRVRDRRRLLALVPWAAVDQVLDADTGAPDHDLRAALLGLPPRRRACLVLRYAFDLPEQEVAELLQIAVGTVKSQTAKAAAQLRRDLEAIEAELGEVGTGPAGWRAPLLAPAVASRSGRLRPRPEATP